MTADRFKLRYCRGCGCDDNHACTVTVTDAQDRVIGEQPCCWIMLDVDTPTGVCSACAVEVEWDGQMLVLMGRDRDGEPLVLQTSRRFIA